jgi:hypothetical protein
MVSLRLRSSAVGSGTTASTSAVSVLFKCDLNETVSTDPKGAVCGPEVEVEATCDVRVTGQQPEEVSSRT